MNLENRIQEIMKTRIQKKGGIDMENLEIRLIVADLRLTYKAIAARIGVTPEYLSRCLRFPLRPEMYSRIMAAIDDLRGGQG